jgi:hypothetical protein
MTIKVIKLITNQDVICEVEDLSIKHVITAKNPMVLYNMISPDGNTISYLKRYNQYPSDKEIKLVRDHVVSEYIPSEVLKTYYEVIVSYYEEIVDKSMEEELAIASDFITKAVAATKKGSSFEEELEKYTKQMIKDQTEIKKPKKVH